MNATQSEGDSKQAREREGEIWREIEGERQTTTAVISL